MQVEIEAATREQQPVLANLLELYTHDFSEILDVQLGADGRFGYADLPLYWQEHNRHPFLIKADGQLAGFALVRQGSLVSGDNDVWDISEFFILRGYRKRGIGMQAVHHVWRKFPGAWEVRVMDKNAGAREFWSHAIARFMGAVVVPTFYEPKRWNVFSFDTRLRKQASTNS
ncbi:MAG: GNAT family N-acetyltransferase [Pyrinomonadaceae bacterium]|nr:GNAT family N-acetyltransferase [Pyrinomonadaceae bacterium]